MGWPLCTFQRRSVLSHELDTICLPSGENAAQFTDLEWSLKGDPMGWPLRASQRRSVLSHEPDTICFPSGEKATDITAPVWPVRGNFICAPLSASQRPMKPLEDEIISFLSEEKVTWMDEGCPLSWDGN